MCVMMVFVSQFPFVLILILILATWAKACRARGCRSLYSSAALSGFVRWMSRVRLRGAHTLCVRVCVCVCVDNLCAHSAFTINYDFYLRKLQFLLNYLMKYLTSNSQLHLSREINFLTKMRKLESSPVLFLKKNYKPLVI
jgi:hypothetical protein